MVAEEADKVEIAPLVTPGRAMIVYLLNLLVSYIV